MEGDEQKVLTAWPSKCTRSIISQGPNATEPNPDVYEGEHSLSVMGGACFIMRLIGPECLTSRLSEDLNEGDTLLISLNVKVSEPNTVFQMESAHYHTNKTRRWDIPDDDSHLISRTPILNADEWTRIEAIHTVGHDWTFGGEVLAPKRCNHYQLRFRAANSEASFIMDNVRINKIGPLQSFHVQKGFLSNPAFAQDHKVRSRGSFRSGIG